MIRPLFKAQGKNPLKICLVFWSKWCNQKSPFEINWPLERIFFPDSWNPSHSPGRVFISHSFRLLIHYSKSWCCFKLFMLIPMRKVDIWFGIHYRNPAEHERYLQYIRRYPKLYIPSTVNIWEKVLTKAILADKRWTGFWQISLYIK